MRADLIAPLPFVAERAEGGISMEKFSLLPVGNGLTELAAVAVEVVVAELGDAPVDDGDMLLSTGLTRVCSRRTDDKVAGGVQPAHINVAPMPKSTVQYCVSRHSRKTLEGEMRRE